jgi:hypothetical protein
MIQLSSKGRTVVAPVAATNSAAMGFAAFLDAVVEADFGAAALRALDLRARRIGRHHDGGLRPRTRALSATPLCVIAGGEGDDAFRLVGIWNAADAIPRAAHLERAGALERFWLDPDGDANGSIERIEAQERCRGR